MGFILATSIWDRYASDNNFRGAVRGSRKNSNASSPQAVSTVALCRGLEKNGMVRAWHGRGMASVNQTWPHCVNQIKTHTKLLAARHGRGTAWARHAMCESAFRLLMMGGVSPETWWVFYKYGIIKILIHCCILLDFSLRIVVTHVSIIYEPPTCFLPCYIPEGHN
jgi:hypothetical protein